MEAEISAFTRGSATVRYSSITLERKEEGRRTKELLSYFKTLTSSSGAQNGCSREPIDFPPSVSQVITEKKDESFKGKDFPLLLSSSSLSTPFFFFFFLIREGKRGRDSDEEDRK